MKPSDMSYCLHEGSMVGEDSDMMCITFCPVEYWKEHECLPDYSIAEDVGEDNLPKGYQWLGCREETMWVSRKTKEEIRLDLSKIGFVENLELENFLTGLCPY